MKSTTRTVQRAPLTRSCSSFDSFLEEEGILEEVEAVAIQRVIAWQLSQASYTASVSSNTRAAPHNPYPNSPRRAILEAP